MYKPDSRNPNTVFLMYWGFWLIKGKENYLHT